MILPRRICVLGVLAFLKVSIAVQAAPIVGNPSFELQGVGYTPAFGPLAVIPSWTFGPSGGASYDGVAGNGFLNLNAALVPDGVQAAFIEGTGTFSQSVSGFTPLASYRVSFFAKGREISAPGPQPLVVSIDAVPLTFNLVPLVTPPSNTTWTLFTSDPFIATSATHTLSFAGTLPFPATDLTSFIDVVSIVPEPAGVALLGLGVIGLFVADHRHRRS